MKKVTREQLRQEIEELNEEIIAMQRFRDMLQHAADNWPTDSTHLIVDEHYPADVIH